MSLFHSLSRYPLGLDISDCSLKIVQLARRRHGFSMQAAAVIDLPAGFIVQGVISNKDGVAKLLSKLQTKTLFGKFSSREVIAGLPEQKTFVKLISAETAKTELADGIGKEIEKHIPYQREDVNYDWQLAGAGSSTMQAFIAAAPKAVTDSYHALSVAAGLYPSVLEPEPVAIARCLLPIERYADKTSVIVDIGAQHACFIAAAEKAVLFTMSLPISGRELTQRLMKKLRIDQRQAEAVKIVVGLEQPEFKNIVTELCEKKIKEAMEYLRAYYPDRSVVEKIYLSGGGSAVNGLAALLAQWLKMPAERGDIFTNLNAPVNLEKKYFSRDYTALKKFSKRNRTRQSFALVFGTATGLALRAAADDTI